MQVDDARRARPRRGLLAGAQECEKSPAVVRVPVREDDALDLGRVDLERGEVPRDGARVGPGVEEREVRGLALYLGLLCVRER